MDAHPRSQSQVLPATLCGTHLSSDEELEEFQRLDTLFEPVEIYSSTELRTFLMRLSTETPKANSRMTVFDTMRTSEDLHVFELPLDTSRPSLSPDPSINLSGLHQTQLAGAGIRQAERTVE